MPETVIKTPLPKVRFHFNSGISENPVIVDIHAQNPDRSYEDRTVYMQFDGKSYWINAENAIELGQHLIQHGSKAFEMNMIQHQLIHRKSKFERFMQEGRIAEVIMSVVSENPPYYGKGFRIFKITPLWEVGKEPEYNENFSYEEVIYFSPFPEEYSMQLKFYGGEKVTFVDYDRAAEVEAFRKACEQFEDSPNEQ